jgi:hypothetical protein
MALYMQPVRVYKECLALYSKSACWGLASFMYTLSGLFPRPITGMIKVRTQWVMSSSVAPKCLVESKSWVETQILP